MSSLVERLAEKWKEQLNQVHGFDPARWWLNAIADELETDGWKLVARWLRSQAPENEDG